MIGNAGQLGRAPSWIAIIVVALGALLWFGVAGHAQAIVSPSRGSALRSEVLNALRPTVEAEVGGQVVFVVNTLNVIGDWAYVSADPKRPDGRKIDWRKTKFRRAFEADAFSELVLALLHRQDRRWVVAEYDIGPTDVPSVEWIVKHKLPEELFKSGYATQPKR